MDKLRIDKWLWAARFYKTRALAVEEISKGRVRVNGVEAKASKEVKPGDEVALRQGALIRTLRVLGISSQRGSAPIAQGLYQESEESLALQKQASEQRHLTSDPASTLTQGRPTKRDRRSLDKAQGKDWDNRWSASHKP